MQYLSDIVLLAVAATAAVTDLQKGRVYNCLVYPAFVVGLLLALGGGLEMLRNHALAAAVGFGLMLVAYMLGGMGGGDVKLVAAIGALAGFSRGADSMFFPRLLFYAFGVAVAIGIVAAIWRGVLGAAVARTWLGLRIYAIRGTTLDDAMPKATIRVPFAFAIAVATAWALAEVYAQQTLGSFVADLFRS